MTKKQRGFLFGVAVIFFVLTSVGVLVLALGFRYDFKENRLVKTGSIVLKPNMEAQIFINGKLEGQTSFLKSSFSKKRLLPGTYQIAITKENFAPWKKEVEVREGLVSDLSKIVLFSEGQVGKKILGQSKLLSLNREIQRAVYGEKNALAFYNLEGQLIYRSEKPSSLDLTQSKVLWGADGREAVVFSAKGGSAFGGDSKAVYFDLSRQDDRELIFPRQISLAEAFLKNGQLYFLQSSPASLGKKDLAVFSIDNLKSNIISKNVSSFFVNKEYIFAMSPLPAAGARLIKMSLSGKNEEIFTTFDSKESPLIKKILSHNDINFILAGSSLYAFKNNKLNFISQKVNDFSVSPDGFMVGWHSGSEFWVYWIKDAESQPFKKAGEIELIFKTAEKIKNFSWYKNSNYVFLESTGSLTAVEVDSRGTPNQYNLSSLAKQEEAWYDLSQNKIFKLSRSSGLASVEMP